MKKKMQKIKRDLRDLRKFNHSIESALKVKENHERRRKYLLEHSSSTDDFVELHNIDKIINSLNIDESIKKANSLELKYMAVIDKLEHIDKTIILDGYINGKPYWKIGKDIGYTERGIQNRVALIVKKIAEMM